MFSRIVFFTPYLCLYHHCYLHRSRLAYLQKSNYRWLFLSHRVYSWYWYYSSHSNGILILLLLLPCHRARSHLQEVFGCVCFWKSRSYHCSPEIAVPSEGLKSSISRNIIIPLTTSPDMCWSSLGTTKWHVAVEASRTTEPISRRLNIVEQLLRGYAKIYKAQTHLISSALGTYILAFVPTGTDGIAVR